MCVQAQRSLPAARGGGGRAPQRYEKLVTLEATTTPDAGDSSAEEGARGRAPEPPASGPRRAPAGDAAICGSSASEGEPGGGGGGRGWRGGGGRFVIGARRARGFGGSTPPPDAGYPREGEKASSGSCLEYASAADDTCAGGCGSLGGGGREDAPVGALLSSSGVRRGGASGWRGRPEATQVGQGLFGAWRNWRGWGCGWHPDSESTSCASRVDALSWRKGSSQRQRTGGRGR